MSRSRHKFINPTSEKSKVNSHIARQRRKVLNMTRNFLKQEREGLYKPLPPGDTDLLLTPDEIQIIKNSEPPTKKRRMTKGGRRKKGRKTRRKKRKKRKKIKKKRKTKKKRG